MWGLRGDKPTVSKWIYDELPTPITSADSYELAIIASKQNIKLTLETDGWVLYGEYDGSIIEVHKVEGSDIKAVRATRVISDINFDEVVDYMFNQTYEKRKILYEELEEYNIVKTFDNTLHIAYTRFKSPFFAVAGRDFLALRHLCDIADGKLIVVRSVNMESYPHDSKAVRGISNCSTYVQKVGNNQIKIITIDYIDPKGSVPSWIINSYVKKAGKRLWGIEELFGPKHMITDLLKK
jgi:hypothetical protein